MRFVGKKKNIKLAFTWFRFIFGNRTAGEMKIIFIKFPETKLAMIAIAGGTNAN